MNSSNSFNICPRCGNSNSLNAKYCSRCGATLKVPTEAVVCHKCHTRNSALANFCRNCGATLKVGAQTKICPRCGREIGAEENMCACGYSFVNMQQTEPRRADVSSTNKEKKRDKKRDKSRPAETVRTERSEVGEKPAKKKKGGRGFAIFALLLIAVFAYAIISQATLRGPLGKFDKGYFYTNTLQNDSDKDIIAIEEDVEGETVTKYVKYFSGYSMIKDVVDLLFNVETNVDNAESLEDLSGLTLYDVYKAKITLQETAGLEQTGKLEFYKQTYGTGAMVILAMIALFLVTSLLHVLSCIIRLIAPRRSKRGNWLYLILAIITTIAAALIIFAHFFAEKEGFLGSIYTFFTPGTTITVGEESTVMYYSNGYAAAYIPIAYWVLWLYSCIAKKKSPKKSKKAD